MTELSLIALVGILGTMIIVPISTIAMLKVTPSRANGTT